MKVISHRGNLRGVNPDKENRPSYIDCAIQLGYEVEVDIRYIDDEFWLGHDEAQYKIERSWMALRKDSIWYHCKDLNSAIELSKLKEFKFFCHTQDNYILTSTGHLWVHDLSELVDETCIIPLLDLNSIKKFKHLKPFAVCTDYVYELL